ncbi:hypothetical protein ON010_g14780 [Phytophthora cinnamomi]|nr:hypothetical protein ON010_g14780 [Phytophthora cinnamomi]
MPARQPPPVVVVVVVSDQHGAHSAEGPAQISCRKASLLFISSAPWHGVHAAGTVHDRESHNLGRPGCAAVGSGEPTGRYFSAEKLTCLANRMKVVSAFAAAVAALLGAAGATDIDSGFTQDGSTTYCMGVTGAVGTPVFDTLQASNVGRCPWSAKSNKDVSNSIFPNAIDSATGLPGAVTVSSLYACTSGTNCATNIAGTPTGADGTSTGAFGSDGTKTLDTNTFTLPTASDYIIVGIVALPGDTSLSLSADEFVVFKKISVVSADTVISSSNNSTTGSVGNSDGSSGPGSSLSTSSSEWATTAPPVTTAPPLTSGPSSSTGSHDKGSSAGHSNSHNQSTVNSHSDASDSSAEQSDKSGYDVGNDEDSLQSGKSTDGTKQGTSTSAPTTSGDTTQQTDSNTSGSTKSTSTSSGSDGFLSGNGVIIVAALVACCIVGVVGFAFVMRRRKEQRTNANKAFDLQSPSMSSDMDDSALNNGGKIDLTYVANISARNNNTAAENMMSEESSVAMMASTERGSEMNSSHSGGSMHSLPKSSLDTDEYSEKVSYGAVGAAGHQNEAEIDAYRMSNMSDLSIAGGAQSEASMSNFGDSVVSARQNQYLQNEWNDSESSRMDSRLDSMEQAELKARGFGSISGFSTVSGLSEDNTRMTGFSEHSNHDIGFSMSSRPTVESRFTEDYRETEDAPTVDDSRFSEDYRATVESHVTEDSRATGFSEAMDESRMQSEVSVDSYGFRASRESADSYSSALGRTAPAITRRNEVFGSWPSTARKDAVGAAERGQRVSEPCDFDLVSSTRLESVDNVMMFLISTLHLPHSDSINVLPVVFEHKMNEYERSWLPHL